MESLARLLAPHAPLVSTIVVVLGVLLAGSASLHAVLYKREPRASIAWVAAIWLLPFAGSLGYLLFGINRLRRRAVELRRGTRLQLNEVWPTAGGTAAALTAAPGVTPAAHQALVTLGDRLGAPPLLPGNRVEFLDGGDAAFPAMLAAIDGARRNVLLGTYIFDSDAAGARFRDRLVAAQARGVTVRVLVDAVGARYHRPRADHFLRAAGLTVARFLPPRFGVTLPTMNLRNHRKVLVVDGAVAFTGGMNIRVGNLLSESPRHPIRDLQARVEGPVVAELVAAFCADWLFTTGERLTGEALFPPLAPAGAAVARALVDGPDEEAGIWRHTFLGALAVAQRRVQILTPYFIPDQGLITALGVAALRGVEVDIVLPDHNNLPFVDWATTALLWQVLQPGCRVWRTPPPFDHSKLLVVDEATVVLGSANWDPRSLRLNFELGLVVHDPVLGHEASALIEARRATARTVTLAEVDGRALPVRLRDGLARMLAPAL